jgi:hypothetical protein
LPAVAAAGGEVQLSGIDQTSLLPCSSSSNHHKPHQLLEPSRSTTCSDSSVSSLEALCRILGGVGPDGAADLQASQEGKCLQLSLDWGPSCPSRS